MQALQWHRTAQEAERITAGGAYREAGWVFTNGLGPLDLKNITARSFKSLLTAYYPLPNIRVYDLRHSHISHLLAAGVPVKDVSKRAGHASAKMTLEVYGHVMPEAGEAAVAKLEAYYATA